MAVCVLFVPWRLPQVSDAYSLLAAAPFCSLGLQAHGVAVPTKLTSRSPCAKDWNTAMPHAQRDALHQWVSGHLGSQHCTLILETGKLECVASELVLEMEDLCNGTALNMLCGMHAEVELLRADQSGLFHAVFSKTPAQVLGRCSSGCC